MHLSNERSACGSIVAGVELSIGLNAAGMNQPTRPIKLLSYGFRIFEISY